MPNFAVIENEKVINIVVAENEYAINQGWVALPDGAGIDWDYVNGQFVDNRPVPEIITTTEPTKEQLMAELAALTLKIQALS